MGQPLWKTVWQFLKKKVKIELPYDPAIPFIQNKQKNKDTDSKRYMHLNRFPAQGVQSAVHFNLNLILWFRLTSATGECYWLFLFDSTVQCTPQVQL